jgi:hypothetical protein
MNYILNAGRGSRFENKRITNIRIKLTSSINYACMFCIDVFGRLSEGSPSTDTDKHDPEGSMSRLKVFSILMIVLPAWNSLY